VLSASSKSCAEETTDTNNNNPVKVVKKILMAKWFDGDT
jgi:hypothetical protein